MVIGHTDRSGVPSYNDLLSLERAESFVAYLRQDVGCWLAWFGQDRPSEKCWSVREDRLMFATIAPTLSDPRIAIAWGAK